MSGVTETMCRWPHARGLHWQSFGVGSAVLENSSQRSTQQSISESGPQKAVPNPVVRSAGPAVGEEAFEGAVVGTCVADLVAVEEVEDALLVGIVDEGLEGEGVGVVFVDGDAGREGLDGEGVLLADDVGEAGGFHAEGAGAPPNGDDHGVDEVALVLVEGFEVGVEVYGQVNEGFGTLRLHDGEAGQEAVAAGVLGGAGLALLGDGAFGFGSVGAGGGYLGFRAGLGSRVRCSFRGLGCVFHRAPRLARRGVGNEPRAINTTLVV